MAAVTWTPAAEEDLERVFEYIAREKESLRAAATVIREIVAKADHYSANPMVAALRPEFGPAIRSFYVHRYVIIYRPVDQGVEIIRVIHGSRDVFRVFRRQEP
jgi:toxin ParE1/3/4